MATRGDPRGYYALLGLEVTASADEIRRAFAERAKLLHPDQGGRSRDTAAFQRLVDAYETLRDPSRRLHYDAESVVMAPEPAAAAPRRAPRPERTRVRDPLARGVPLPRLGPLLAGLAAIGVLALIGTWLWLQRAEINRQNHQIAALTVDLERARDEGADVNARYAAANGGGGSTILYSKDLVFAQGSSDLDAGMQQQLAEAVAGAAKAIGTVPPQQPWLIVIEGQAARAANEAGLEIDAWQAALVRAGLVVDRMVREGLPADHVALRFTAGLARQAGGDEDRTVRLRVECCVK